MSKALNSILSGIKNNEIKKYFGIKKAGAILYSGVGNENKKVLPYGSIKHFKNDKFSFVRLDEGGYGNGYGLSRADKLWIMATDRMFDTKEEAIEYLRPKGDKIFESRPKNMEEYIIYE